MSGERGTTVAGGSNGGGGAPRCLQVMLCSRSLSEGFANSPGAAAPAPVARPRVCKVRRSEGAAAAAALASIVRDWVVEAYHTTAARPGGQCMVGGVSGALCRLPCRHAEHMPPTFAPQLLLLVECIIRYKYNN